MWENILPSRQDRPAPSAGGSRIFLRPRIEGRTILCDVHTEGPIRNAFFRSPPDARHVASFGPANHAADTYDIDLDGLPPSIAVLPTLANVLPVAWHYDAEIHLDEVDEDFLFHSQGMLRAFREYYPELPAGGRIVAKRVVPHYITEPLNPPIVMFSGGVDATFSFLGHLALRPTAVIVRGTEIYFTPQDDRAWVEIEKSMQSRVAELGLPLHTVDSNFKFSLFTSLLEYRIPREVMLNWWHGMQHGLPLIALAAPLAWQLKSKRIIISSSFSRREPMVLRAGSNPLMDESIGFFGARVTHCDFTSGRQDKIDFIVAETGRRNLHTHLRVCWQGRSEINCCKCDKCLRTMLGVYATGHDPRDFGFDLTAEREAAAVARLQDPAFRGGPMFYGFARRLAALAQDGVTRDGQMVAGQPIPRAFMARFGERYVALK